MYIYIYIYYIPDCIVHTYILNTYVKLCMYALILCTVFEHLHLNMYVRHASTCSCTTVRTNTLIYTAILIIFEGRKTALNSF